jgi:hypothetical protein
MALQKLPTNDISKLIVKHIDLKEWGPTSLTIKELAHVKANGFLSKNELFKVARWKSPRAAWRVNENSAAQIKKLTTMAFNEKDEAIKMRHLIGLKGVGIPMASAILMLTNPQKYGVIDIRVWQLLHHVGAVDQNKAGINFTIQQWLNYLDFIRIQAKNLKVKARDIDRTLFLLHKEYQLGKLK